MSGIIHSRPFLWLDVLIHMSQSQKTSGAGHFASSSPLYNLRLRTLQKIERFTLLEIISTVNSYRTCRISTNKRIKKILVLYGKQFFSNGILGRTKVKCKRSLKELNRGASSKFGRVQNYITKVKET